MRMTRKMMGVVAVVGATALLAAPAASAHTSADPDDGSGHHAGRGWHTKVLTTKVIAPFHLATEDDDLYVADGGTSTVSKIRDNGSLRTVATGPQPGEVAGVAVTEHALAYTTTNYATHATTLTIKRGSKTVVADLSGFESKHNPDAKVHYGLKDPSCAAKVLGPMASYTGQVDSHPYAVTAWRHGSWIVADAGGNDLLKVDRWGKVSLLTVLPTQPLVITKAFADANGVPKCVGQTYKFEAVPTDVEVGPGGMLYVTTLPGGPEDPSAGARGSVYRVNPWNGHATRIATGFAGATSLTIGPDRTIYVAELFAGRVSKVRHGHPQAVVALPGVVSVEYGEDHLYAGTMAPMDAQGNPTGHGSVVRLR
ncbi:ScyD/ScyE family protein [Pedococcus sp. KACC 23699]|uniref:ScyD/ScyE family protein n=1 Tax=Pedococcus sp. KACC 23699 TaxID=3149228 RepID=A0AAU7JS48_9MICO